MVERILFELCSFLTSHASLHLRLITVIAKKFCLRCRLILLRAADMKCATVFVLVCIAFVSPALAVLRPLFPAKPAPPFSGELTAIGNDSFRSFPGEVLTTAPR
jgi:hypothetical protein